jgi:hypothetical protein
LCSVSVLYVLLLDDVLFVFMVVAGLCMGYLMCIVILSVCVVFSCLFAVLNVLMFAQLPGGWLEVSTRKVLRPATSAQVFLLGFPVSTFKCIQLTYLLTQWSRILLEKLTDYQLVKKFSTFYGTGSCITAYACAGHLCLF